MAEFSSGGARLIFEGDVRLTDGRDQQWKVWEVEGVEALVESLGADVTWSKAELLRFLHLAVSYRNEGSSGTDYKEEDIVLAKDLLLKRKEWLELNRPVWTPALRNSFARQVFLQGHDRSGRPVVVVRPLEESRETWSGHWDDLVKAIFALTDVEVDQGYRPGVAEQSVWIIDLHAIGLLDVPAMVPILGKAVTQLTAIWPSRGGTIFVVNAGWTLSATVNAVLMFAQAESREKVQVFRGALDATALEVFDLETLPVEFGGKAAMGCLEEIKQHTDKEEVQG